MRGPTLGPSYQLGLWLAWLMAHISRLSPVKVTRLMPLVLASHMASVSRNYKCSRALKIGGVDKGEYAFNTPSYPPCTESLNSQWMWNCCGPRYDLDCECRFEGSMCIIIIVEGQVAYWRGPNTPSNWFNGNNDNNKVDRSVPGSSGVGNPVNQSTSANTFRPNQCPTRR